jgi:hypothetical protein
MMSLKLKDLTKTARRTARTAQDFALAAGEWHFVFVGC